jgi:hypothetical protein
MKKAEPKYCPIHNCVMRKKRIRIMYGFPVGPMGGYMEEREKSFPNCDDYLLGGCEVGLENQPLRKTKYVCDECNSAREKWKSEHPIKEKGLVRLWY